MNFLEKGINWFSEKRDSQVSEPVKVVTATTSRRVRASVIEPESNVNAEGVRVKSSTYMFIFKKNDIKNLDLKRGIQIIRNEQTYEIIAMNKVLEEYNDSLNLEVAYPAKLLCS